MSVRIVDSSNETDVNRYKEIRLRALSLNPEAFGSTFEREVQFDDETWRRRLSTFGGRPGSVFIAEDRSGATGIVGVGMESPDDHAGIATAYLWGMWVDPRARGTGTAVALVEASIESATQMGAQQIVLDVVRENLIAIQLYARLGFLPTGRVGGLPSDPCDGELEMRLSLPGGRGQ